MKSHKFLFIVFLFLFFYVNIYANSISDDAKKAIKEYAGYKELQNRGFNLKMLDKIQTPEDMYNVLLPYMVVDGRPLDNFLSFNGYNFQRHKTIHFENVYGTIQELLNKGYKPEQLFYYPTKGKDIHRVGNFVWEKPEPVSYPWTNVCFYNRPFIGKKIVYFWIGSLAENYFTPYLKEIQKKESIILDLRLFQGGWENQFYNLFETLCKSGYKGKVILIIDETTFEGGLKNYFRNSFYINGSQKNVNYEIITVGENTIGKQNYTNNAKWNYNIGELQFSPLPVNENRWKNCEEGEGIMPDIWADGEDDINKTIELLTGETDFANLIKDVTEWRNYLCSSDKAFWNFDWNNLLPDTVKKIKSNSEYNEAVTKLLKPQIQYQTLTINNGEILQNYAWWFPFPKCSGKAKNFKEYYEAYSKYMDAKFKWLSFILDNKETINTIGYGLNFPDCFNSCNSFSIFSDCFSKWIDKRIEWCELSINKLDGIYYTWWEFPEFFKSFKTAEQYTDYFIKWYNLRIWWCTILSENQYVLEHNNIRVWSDALKEEIKEWKNPDKHLAELTVYLKNMESWIVYLQPHPFVIPKDYGVSNLYASQRRTSDKIGKNCSSVPEKIRNLQKTNPEEYGEKIVEYINSVAENDFERVKLVFDIEQEILTYDNDDYQQMLNKINKAREGVGEDYDTYQKNLNELYKNDTNVRPGQDWKSVLENGKCVCEGYSRLMQYFCYRLGIKCDILHTPKDMIFAVGHSWNIVEINGEHYCVDATWGPAYLYMEPEAFLKAGHFPTEPEQQLLVPPMTLDEYKKLKNYFPID